VPIPDNKGVREENWMEPNGKFYPEKMQEIVDQLKARSKDAEQSIAMQKKTMVYFPVRKPHS
jgi:hypothetical protein